MIPFKVKLLTSTAKAPHRNCEGDLWDLFADGFCLENVQDGEFRNELPFNSIYHHQWHFDGGKKVKTRITFFDEQTTEPFCIIQPQGRVLIRTGISLELPVSATYSDNPICEDSHGWVYESDKDIQILNIYSYAVADLRPRSGLALKHGITVLNTPGTIDNSYRKEIGVILINHGHEDYTIKKDDKICQMLIRPLYPSKMEIVSEIEDTGRGGYNSTGY